MQSSSIKKVISMNNLIRFQKGNTTNPIQKCCTVPYSSLNKGYQDSLKLSNLDFINKWSYSIPCYNGLQSSLLFPLTNCISNQYLSSDNNNSKYMEEEQKNHSRKKRENQSEIYSSEGNSFQETGEKLRRMDSSFYISTNQFENRSLSPEINLSVNKQEDSEEETVKSKAETLGRSVHQLRQWQYTTYGRNHLRNQKNGLEFTLMSYNLLAQQLLENNSWLYYHCEPSILNWEYRSKNLLQEIQELYCDIICLQEVQRDHYYNLFRPVLENLGYYGLYKKRTSEKCDGCAIFFKTSMFSLIDYHLVEFYRPEIPLLNRDNVAIIVLLKPKYAPPTSDLKLCVATTHLLFNPKRGDIKLAQIRLLLAELDKIAFKEFSSNKKSIYYPIIMCGDMNSEPFSPLYNFISKGKLNCTNLLSGEISGQKEGTKKRGTKILDFEELLHPEIEITKDSQFEEILKIRHNDENAESTIYSNDYDTILIKNQDANLNEENIQSHLSNNYNIDNFINEKINCVDIDKNSDNIGMNSINTDEMCINKGMNSFYLEENDINSDEKYINKDMNPVYLEENDINSDEKCINKGMNPVYLEDDINSDDSVIIIEDNTVDTEEKCINIDMNPVFMEENHINSDDSVVIIEDNAINTEKKISVDSEDNSDKTGKDSITVEDNSVKTGKDSITVEDNSVKTGKNSITVEDNSNLPFSSNFQIQDSTVSLSKQFSSPPKIIRHHLNLLSTYKHICSDGSWEITTQHTKANCTVDYIFYSVKSKYSYIKNSKLEHKHIKEGALKLLASYRLLNNKEIKEVGGLPNACQSSDHLSLVNKFLLKTDYDV